LPPEEKKAKLEAQLTEIKEVIASEVKSKKGIAVITRLQCF
jgi:hypothetical protein